MKMRLFFAVFILLLSGGFFAQNAFADVPPSPVMRISLAFDPEKISEDKIYGNILFCGTLADAGKYADQGESLIPELKAIREYDAKKDCYWYPSNGIYDNRDGSCSANNYCEFTLWRGAIIDYKFAVFLPNLNKVLISDEISSYEEAVNDEGVGGYNKNLTADGSVKIEKIHSYYPSYKRTLPDWPGPPVTVSPLIPSAFSVALIQTLIAELLVALIFVLTTKISKKILLTVLLGNLISLPMVWFLFPLLSSSSLITLPLSEIFAVFFEAYLIYFLNKKTISFKRALLLSFLMNLLSFLFPPPLY